MKQSDASEDDLMERLRAKLCLGSLLPTWKLCVPRFVFVQAYVKQSDASEDDLMERLRANFCLGLLSEAVHGCSEAVLCMYMTDVQSCLFASAGVYEAVRHI
jgi:hypothetical protein